MAMINVDEPKTVTVHYINNEKYEPSKHQGILRIYQDGMVWILYSKNKASAQIKFDEVLRVEYEFEDIPKFPEEA